MTMPAGKYYVGDLCYVMTDEEWEEFCGITINGNKCIDGEFQLSDLQIGPHLEKQRRLVSARYQYI